MRRWADSPTIPKRVFALAKILRDNGVSEQRPIRPDDALNYRGVGPETLPYLEELGLICLDDFDDLPTKIGNLLRRLGFKSRGEVVAAVRANSLVLDRSTVYFRPSPDHEFHHVRNCAAHTFHQIRAWAGFDAPGTQC